MVISYGSPRNRIQELIHLYAFIISIYAIILKSFILIFLKQSEKTSWKTFKIMV